MNVNELVERAKQNDNDAIKELYDLTARKGYFIALKYMNNEESANDVLQNAYVKVFQKLDTLEDNSRFESFLYTTITREAINFGKSKEEVHKTKAFSDMNNEENGLEFEESIEDDTLEFQPDSAVDYSELKQAMNQIINELPQDQKMAILMYYFEELSVGEIAETFSVTKNTIKSRLKYGRNRIREKVEEMQKSGRPIFGIAPIPFLLWMFQEEAYATSAPAMSAKIFSATQLIGNKATSTIAKEGVKAAGKTISKKIIAGVISAAIVMGGGAYVLSQNNNTHFKPKKNDNQQIETEQTESQKIYNDLNAKDTYEKAVNYFNENVHYFIYRHEDDDIILKIEKFYTNGEHNNITMYKDKKNGSGYINIITKDQAFGVNMNRSDDKLEVVTNADESNAKDIYEKNQVPFMNSIKKRDNYKIISMKKSNKEKEIIIEIKYMLDGDENYYFLRTYINKKGYLYKEELKGYSDENMENQTYEAIATFKDINKKDSLDFEKEKDRFTYLDGLSTDAIDELLD